MQGDAGQRGFMTVINLNTGGFLTAQGSYGGSNPFEKTVDDMQPVKLQAGMVVITGVMGSTRPVFAKITANPDNVARLLPNYLPLSQRELTVLYAFRALKGGEARRDHFRRYEVKQSEIDALEAKGLIKVNKAGAAQITTEGRNSFPTPLWSPPPSRLYGMSGGAWSPPWSR